MSNLFLRVIACEVALREICQVISRSPNIVDLEFLTQGLHTGPIQKFIFTHLGEEPIDRGEQFPFALFRVLAFPFRDGERSGCLDVPDGRGDERDDKKQNGGRGAHRQERVPPAPAPDLFDGRDGPGFDRLKVQIMPQVVGQGLGRTVAACRVLLQAFQADRLHIPIDGRIEFPGTTPALHLAKASPDEFRNTTAHASPSPSPVVPAPPGPSSHTAPADPPAQPRRRPRGYRSRHRRSPRYGASPADAPIL